MGTPKVKAPSIGEQLDAVKQKLPVAREDLLPLATEVWDTLKRTKKEKKQDVQMLALFIQSVHRDVIRAISDYVSMHAINVAKGNPTHPEALARQGLLVRALAEVANKILTLDIKQGVKNDEAPVPEGQTLPKLD